MTAFNPERWPLAPGNAPAEVEALLQAEAAKWPEPTAAQRQQVSRILGRADRRIINAKPAR